MTKSRLALLVPMMLASSPALAADLTTPEMRPSTFEASVGVFGATNAADTWYNNGCACERGLGGIGYGLGLRGGIDYTTGPWLLGATADWTFGGPLATNESPAEPGSFDMGQLMTMRGKAGVATEDASLYLTAGLAMAQTELTANIPLAGGGTAKGDDTQWTYGWTIGTGLDVNVTDKVSVGLEYLFVHLDGVEYDLGPGPNNKGNAFQSFEGIHTVRLGVNYAFTL